MKRIVVLGANGMAGHVVAAYLKSKSGYAILGLARQPGPYVDHCLDVTHFSSLEDYLVISQPDYVINCIGLLVAASEQDISKAILINSYLPHFISRVGKAIGFKLIHISTDCVFSGKSGNYEEDAFRDGDDNYARSKALGEVVNSRDLTIRTSIIGPELKKNGSGLLGWFLQQSGEVKGFGKAYWSGVTTLELAKAIHAMMLQNILGLYQLCPNKKISKYELLNLIASEWKKNIIVAPDEQLKVDKSLVCTRTDLNYPRPEYDKMLREMRKWMWDYRSLYDSFFRGDRNK